MSEHLIETTLRILSRSSGGEESAEVGGPAEPENIEALYERARAVAAPPNSPGAHHLERQSVIGSYLDAGRAALQEIVAHGEAARLDARQLSGLEAIVRLTGRPSFLMKGGRVEGVPRDSEWFEPLIGAQDSLQQVSGSVGRVNLPGTAAPGYGGTAFMVAPGVLMTNRHVALQFAQQKDKGQWIVAPGCAPAVDFMGEDQQPAGPAFPISAVLLMHPNEELDLALLRVEPATEAPLPAPLYLSTQEAVIVKSKPVYAIGYPASDSHNDASELARIFGDIFGVKRLAPGEIMRGRWWLGTSFRHDCTTLGGSSGSCIVDFNTHRVLGLHFGGNYLKANFALSLPYLRSDEHLRNAGVMYG